MAKQVWIQNGVVLSDDGVHIYYNTVCPHCGFMNRSTRYSASVNEHINYSTPGSTCSKCHKSFQVKYGRG